MIKLDLKIGEVTFKVTTEPENERLWEVINDFGGLIRILSDEVPSNAFTLIFSDGEETYELNGGTMTDLDILQFFETVLDTYGETTEEDTMS